MKLETSMQTNTQKTRRVLERGDTDQPKRKARLIYNLKTATASLQSWAHPKNSNTTHTYTLL